MLRFSPDIQSCFTIPVIEALPKSPNKCSVPSAPLYTHGTEHY